MKKFESIEDVAQALGDGGPFSPDTNFETVEQVVDALVERGNRDEVFCRYDEHLGLKIDLPDKFLSSQLDDIDKPDFEQYIETILEQANIIIPLSERELLEDDYDEINEDKILRGEADDD
jgi:hypothetical protein